MVDLSTPPPLDKLRQCVFKFNKGIPDHLRGKIYKFLLQIKFDTLEIERNFNNFRLLSFFVNPTFDDLSQDVIEHDIERTRSTSDFFRMPDIKFLMKALLTFYSKYICPYKQGMNEVLAPLLYLINDTFLISDVYNSFTVVIQRYLCNMYMGENFSNLKLVFHIFTRILWYHDPVIAFVFGNFFSYLEKNEVTPDMYCTWWFLTLFSSKHDLEVVYCLWDYYFAENNISLFLFIGIALILENRQSLLSCDPSHLPEVLSKLRIEGIKQLHQVIYSFIKIWNIAKSLQSITPLRLVEYILTHNSFQVDNQINYSRGVFIVSKEEARNNDDPMFIIDIRPREVYERDCLANCVHFDINKDWNKTTTALLRSIYNMNEDSFFRSDIDDDHLSSSSMKSNIGTQPPTGTRQLIANNPSFSPSNPDTYPPNEPESYYLDYHYYASEDMISYGYSEQDRKTLQNFSVSNLHLVILSDPVPSPFDYFYGRTKPKCTLTSFYRYLTQHCLLPRVSVLVDDFNNITTSKTVLVTQNTNTGTSPFEKIKSAITRISSINSALSPNLSPLDIISWSGICTLENHHYVECYIDNMYQPSAPSNIRWLSCFTNYQKLLSKGVTLNYTWGYFKGKGVYRLVLSKKLILIVSKPIFLDLEVCDDSSVDYYVSGKKVCLSDAFVYQKDPCEINWSERISDQAKLASKDNRKNVTNSEEKEPIGNSTECVYVYGAFRTSSISKITSAVNNSTLVSFYFTGHSNEPLIRCKFFAEEDTRMCMNVLKTLYKYSSNK